MKKIVKSLPFRLLAGVVLGILVGLAANETVMQVILTAKNLLGISDHLLCAPDHYRVYRAVYHPPGK